MQPLLGMCRMWCGHALPVTERYYTCPLISSMGHCWYASFPELCNVSPSVNSALLHTINPEGMTVAIERAGEAEMDKIQLACCGVAVGFRCCADMPPKKCGEVTLVPTADLETNFAEGQCRLC